MEKFIQTHKLRPGDRIVVPRSILRWIQHHAIYWGKDRNGVHWIIENKDFIGVRYIKLEDFLIDAIEVKRIEYMDGLEIERHSAIKRAEALVGKPYDLFLFNCEHYANHVQYGTCISKQIDDFKEGLKVVAGIGLFILVVNSISKSR